MRSLLPLLLLAGCAASAAPPEPPGEETLPPVRTVPDLRAPALRARGAVEEVLGRPVPEDAAMPVVASREEMARALLEELRPQVEMLYPDAPPAARDLLLRSTTQASSRSLIARYSAERKRVLFPPENLLPQMAALGLPTDAATVRDFVSFVLAHEMVHAVDDEAHDLAGLFRSVPDAEALRALGMAVEGRAVHFARRAADLMGIDGSISSVLPAEKGELNDYRARFLLTYRQGAAFAAALDERGLAGRLLADPPRRTDTLFHPERYGPKGEGAAPDLAAAMRKGGFEGAAAASELDLRARWLPVLGDEATTRAFRGFLAGAGRQGAEGGASVSLHETPADAAAYAEGLRRIYGDAKGAVVLVDGRAVASGIGADAATAKANAERALAAAK